MITPSEFRPGNLVLYKESNRINMVKLTLEHFQKFATADVAGFFPVALKEELLTKWGFTENKEYALYPQAHEFRQLLPVKGNNTNELIAYIKSNKECFCVASVNGLVVSNPVHQLHQLQNLYYALTGEEMEISI